MKQYFFPALKMTLASIIVCVVLYTLLILGIAQLVPGKGEGQVVSQNGIVKGYLLEGQSFTQDNYFQGRPSAAGYNAAGSSGSNKGPSNPDYLQVVKDRIDSFLVHNPQIKREDIPADLVTASGSGLDPHISTKTALIQVPRIAKSRNLTSEKINHLIYSTKEKPLLGLFGTETVSVLALNLALDNLK